MTEKTVDQAARTLHKEIATRAWQFRMLGMKEPLLTAFDDKDFIARAHDLGYESVSKLWGAVSAAKKDKNGTNSAKPPATTNGSAKPAVIKPASAKERYKALITQERTFMPGDALLGQLLKVSPARVSHIRSELSAEDFVFEKVDNGFFVSPPKPKPVPVEEPSTAVVEAQLPLPATAVEPEAITVAGTLGDLPRGGARDTESDLAVVLKKLAHIEVLLVALPNAVALLTDIYVQSGRHHTESFSEQRQLRALIAQLLSKWN